jgi:hypothetical protein
VGEETRRGVDTNKDDSHCGRCWNRCDLRDEKCIAGKCTKVCPSSRPVLCDAEISGRPGTSVCVNTFKSDYHCGACFNVCQRDQSCKNGKCECDAGTTACPWPNNAVRCLNNMTSDIACGGCPTAGGRVCPSNQRRYKGQCQCWPNEPTACISTTGQTLCFNTQTDTRSCDSCFNQCAWDQKCVGGQCIAV